MDAVEAVDRILLEDELTPRTLRRRKDETPEDHADRCLTIAGAAMRRAYGRGYLDAPLPDDDVLAEARRQQAEAWARLPIPE